ncbi:MAG: hypothetical protein ACHP79_11105, partial [Terriglobales bacterium]
PYAASPAAVAKVQNQPLNGIQKGLVDLATNLPTSAVNADPNDIALHIDRLQNAPRIEAPAAAALNVRDAAAYVKRQLGDFFSSA